MILKKELADAPGLSCVEKYFISWLSRFTDIKKLYGSAFVSLVQVFGDFSRGATYQYYGYLPRLQEVAEENGMVTHTYRPCSAADAMEILRSASDDTLCLMRVNTAFFTHFKRASWREDHYVCVNGDLEWINEYPLSNGIFTAERFKEVFDGALCLYVAQDVTADVPDGVTDAFATQNCTVDKFPFGLNNLEWAIGVLRVTRKRMAVFFENNRQVAQALCEEIELLDKVFFDIRMRQLKEKKGEKTDKSKAHAELCEKMQAVIAAEKRAMEMLNQ